jgi:hypothetical protein
MALFLISLVLFLTIAAIFEERKYGDAQISFFIALMSLITLSLGVALLIFSESVGEGIAAFILIIASIMAIVISFLEKYFKETALITGAGLVLAGIALFIL